MLFNWGDKILKFRKESCLRVLNFCRLQGVYCFTDPLGVARQCVLRLLPGTLLCFFKLLTFGKATIYVVINTLSREAGARFINLDISSLTDKWYGESQKIAGAVFTLAKKIQPCIIFIDEIDSLLRVRSQQDHEATSMIKAQFLQLWDGLATDKGQCVLVLGATNRPKDVDSAILRRMPATFRLGLPDLGQRKEILRAVLKLEKVGESVDLIRLAKLTEGWSGSDLRELCRAGAVQRVKELGTEEQELRPISMEDMLNALSKMRESRLDTGQQVMAAADLD